MARNDGSNGLGQKGLPLPSVGRPVVHSTQGVISSGHYLTSMAGMRMLLTGGNAFDAAVAASFAAAVVEPMAAYSLAAEGVFMLHHAGSGKLLSLSGQGTAPAKATAGFFTSQGLERIPTGPGRLAHLSFTVPGIVDALLSLLEDYGTKPVGEALAPAIHYAERGIPNYEYMLGRLKAPVTGKQFDNYPPGGWDVFYNDRELPSPGSLLVQPGLANTLKSMVAPNPRDPLRGPADPPPIHTGRRGSQHAAESETRAEGIRLAREVFYRGSVARTIAECSERTGGILALEDLAGYRSKYEQPVGTTFRGYEIWGPSAWTQGPALMQTLNMLEHFDLEGLGYNSPAYIHTVAEAMKLAFADREAYYGDTDFSEIPVEGLLSKEYAAERAKLIDPARAWPELPAYGDPWRYTKNGASSRAATASVPAGARDGDNAGNDGTTYVTALDREGNMVSATISGGAFAKSVFFPELGCALSTRSEMFNCQDGHPNVVEPGKRPRTTLVNYIVCKDGQPVMTIGCPGGDHQAQANVQLILNTLVFGMDPQQAIEAPRFSTQTLINSFHPHVYLPGQLDLERAIPESTAEELRALGHKTERVDGCGVGATVARRDAANGVLSTGADPRRSCYALGW